MIASNKIATASLLCLAAATAIAATPPLLNDPVDISGDFHALENFYYLAATTAKGLIFLPTETEAHELTLTKSGDSFKLDADPLAGRVAWKISGREIH